MCIENVLWSNTLLVIDFGFFYKQALKNFLGVK